VAERAVEAVPESLPEFFRYGGAEVARASLDPDLLRRPDLPQLRDQEYPEHYLDYEYLEGANLPETRYEYVGLLAERDLDGSRVGFLPYALVEGVQRLAVAFAQHRAAPGDLQIQAKALYFAGVLAHYAADLCQPLHTSIHHNGRALPDGSSPGSGIHHLVDSLLDRLGVDARPQMVAAEVRSFASDPLAAVIERFLASHQLVDRIYELEPELEWQEGESPSAAVRSLASQRLEEGVAFTASLFFTAWDLSAGLEVAEDPG
jgi:hypothetical protein